MKSIRNDGSEVSETDRSIPFHNAFFPRVMTSADIVVMSMAYQQAMREQAGASDPVDSETLSRTIYRLYSKGLTDQQKLANLAQLLAASAIARRQAQ
ncbi:hypothetical protein LH464_24100 [Neorhizobium sp. T786]|uniref:hypothetical protein n=1 Tax=Pseudorhizobium xiangyangii TaxID=2883104 RepID=UPI001CFFFF39|nr:hypothetical protein [Neorhizobium xiangyangii]MCB5205525.1 hypothetical protein [Neorhizobium xiangyangii]